MAIEYQKVRLAECGREQFNIRVDPKISLEKLIDLGEYDWVHPVFRDRCFDSSPSDQSPYEITAYLISLTQISTAIEVNHWLETTGLRSLQLCELLTFACAYPAKQREYAILATGATIESSGVVLVPYLAGGERDRALGFNWAGDGWGEFARFAATPGSRTAFPL